MDTIKAIVSRRSIRKFKEDPVGRELLHEIVRAGMYAPSARNTQSWYFIVVEERPRLCQLADLHPYGRMLKNAGAAVLVCGDQTREDSLIYQVQNCSAATQNMLLAAHELGLGAVWLGVQPREQRISDLKSFFNLPEHIVPVSLIAIGHPANPAPAPPQRFHEDRIVYEKWPDQ